MKLFLFIIVLASAFVFSKCAQQLAPTGGERDIYAPILDTNKVSPAEPPNFSTNFASSQVVLTFNEFFALSEPNKNIIITPIPLQKPIYRVKGKKLIIELGDKLSENTTYTINFGSSIKDITEGNVVKNFNYVFSTGSFIDSLTFQGKVIDAYTKRGVPNATVILYNETYDSLPFSGIPNYFVKTGKNGNFKMRYLKAGTYKIVALLDENSDYKYNPKNESIAFWKELVNIESSVKDDSVENTLILFKEDVKRQFVLEKKYVHKGKVELILNRTSDNINIKGVNEFKLNKDWTFYTLKKDTIEFWIDSNDLDNKSFQIAINDEENKFYDTVKIGITHPKGVSPTPFKFSSNVKKGLNQGENLRLMCSKPIALIDANSMRIESNDKNIPFEVKKRGKEAIVTAKWKAGPKYIVTVFPSALTSVYGETTDTVKFSFAYKSEKDYGKLILNLELEQGSYILQLLQKDNVVSELIFEGSEYKKTFNQLNFGMYNLKLFYDTNKNGKWDTGDYLKKKQPEKVAIYNKEVSIRQGWDVDITWKIE